MTAIEQRVLEAMTSPPFANHYSVGSIMGRMPIRVNTTQAIRAIESLIIQGKVRIEYKGQVYFAPVVEVADAS